MQGAADGGNGGVLTVGLGVEEKRGTGATDRRTIYPKQDANAPRGQPAGSPCGPTAGCPKSPPARAGASPAPQSRSHPSCAVLCLIIGVGDKVR